MNMEIMLQNLSDKLSVSETIFLIFLLGGGLLLLLRPHEFQRSKLKSLDEFQNDIEKLPKIIKPFAKRINKGDYEETASPFYLLSLRFCGLIMISLFMLLLYAALYGEKNN